MTVGRRATTLVAATAAVASLVGPGAWGAWQDSGSRAGGLHSAELGYSLTGSNVTGGGTGYNWSFLLSLAGATDHLSVTNTGSVAETIRATVSISGLGSSVTVYGCPNTFSGITCTGRATLGSASPGSPATIDVATTLAAGATYNLAVRVPGLLGLTVTVLMPANTFTIVPRTGINRTSG